MTQTHPLTPPDELLEHWRVVGNLGNWQNALTLAYRAGADQELEACWQMAVGQAGYRCVGTPSILRNARRPKPPSLKAQALAELKILSDYAHGLGCSESAIRRALEALPE